MSASWDDVNLSGTSLRSHGYAPNQLPEMLLYTSVIALLSTNQHALILITFSSEGLEAIGQGCYD